MRCRSWLVPLTLAFALAALAGCTQKPAEEPSTEAPPPAPFRVTGVLLGKSIRPDMMVAVVSTTFTPRDTIYASVATDGASPGVTLKTRWLFQDGSVVNEASQTIAPSGPSVTEFHVSLDKPWPRGKYTVEVWADSVAADTLEYLVQ